MDSLEDRIAADGNHDKLVKALKTFRKERKTRDAQHELYEVLTGLGASSEEADEFINLEMES